MSQRMKSFTSSIGGLESTIVFRASPCAVPIDRITGFKPDKRIGRFNIVADEQFTIGEAWLC